MVFLRAVFFRAVVLRLAVFFLAVDLRFTVLRLAVLRTAFFAVLRAGFRFATRFLAAGFRFAAVLRFAVFLFAAMFFKQNWSCNVLDLSKVYRVQNICITVQRKSVYKCA